VLMVSPTCPQQTGCFDLVKVQLCSSSAAEHQSLMGCVLLQHGMSRARCDSIGRAADCCLPQCFHREAASLPAALSAESLYATSAASIVLV
jgi:hypothetical protein